MARIPKKIKYLASMVAPPMVLWFLMREGFRELSAEKRRRIVASLLFSSGVTFVSSRAISR